MLRRFFHKAYSKKNLCIFGYSGEGCFQESPIFKVLQAKLGLYVAFNGNLTAYNQVVFQAKNLKKFSDIKLSHDDSS